MAGTIGIDALGVAPFNEQLLSQVSQSAVAGGMVVSGLADILSSIGSFGTKPTVGVCIGAANAKVAEVRKVGKTWKLVRFGISALPEDSVVNREIFNPVGVTGAIQAAVSQAKISQKLVVTGMGGSSIILKRMTVEVQRASELQDAVFWEAEQYLPFDPSEVSMDFHTISRGKDAKTDVLFVAAKLSVMDGFVSAVEGAGLKVKVFDTEYFALQNIFEANYDARPGEAVALVDIGASTLKVLVLHDGVPVFTKESPMGGKNLTAEIQRQMNLSMSDAEALKVGQGRGAVPQEIAELTQVAVENFATEIRRALDFYNASSSGAPVSYVLVTGGSSQIPELSKGIEERVGLPVQILNPFARIGYDEKVFTPELIASIAPVVAVPMGYALRGGQG
ncbi:MAG: type IV pilus assembly protein PilM [Bdellovibrionales bacterium]|nr:type IV pilus assembly protein PilM [Bdellovibrionales bacterium]